jgi:hypothetical protein
MSFHRNAKLRLACRYALVSAIAGGMTLKGGRGCLQRLAGRQSLSGNSKSRRRSASLCNHGATGLHKGHPL